VIVKPEGYLTVTSEPSGATILITDSNGTTYREGTPFQRKKLPPGNYTIRATKNGYVDKRITVTIADGQTSQQPITLEQKRGRLRIISTPPGATIYLDNRRQAQKTPNTFSLPIGTYQIKLEMEDHKLYTSSATVKYNETETISTKLIEIPTFGEIQVNSSPWAYIYLDDEKESRGTTPQTLKNIRKGKHKVRLVVPDYMEHIETVNVIKNQRAKISYTFPKHAKLTINCIPWGNVYIDGKSKGTTPVTLDKISVGSHELKITRSGYKELIKTIAIQEGDNKISEKLEKE